MAKRSKKIHAAGLLGGFGKRATWCGRFVDDDQLPIIGTTREIDCKSCAQSKIARQHARRWDYDYWARWEHVLRETGDG